MSLSLATSQLARPLDTDPPFEALRGFSRWLTHPIHLIPRPMTTPFKKRYLFYALLMLLAPMILNLLAELVLDAVFWLFCCGVLLFCLVKTAYQKVTR